MRTLGLVDLVEVAAAAPSGLVPGGGRRCRGGGGAQAAASGVACGGSGWQARGKGRRAVGQNRVEGRACRRRRGSRGMTA